MRIVIDMQGAQTESRFRGIGRYSLSLAQAIVRNRADHEVFLALSDLFPDTIEPLKAAFADLLPEENIRVWVAPGPTREVGAENKQRREMAELIREAALAELDPDVVLVTSLFEGLGDDAITSVGNLDVGLPTAVIIYDLIPLISPDIHFRTSPLHQDWYGRKLESLKRASLLLAISESSRTEAVENLHKSPDEVVNISCACDPSFGPTHITQHEKDSLFQRAGVTRPFIMYTGGADERKNLHRLIEAFAALPSALRKQHQLLMVGKMPEESVRDFLRTAAAQGLRSDELVIAGYVGDEDLISLYGSCSLFVFPSTHEGFGLPPLEAMSCGAVVIAADAASLPEVMGMHEALFDPLDVASISEAMARALADPALRRRLLANAKTQSQAFSWDQSARLTIEALGRFAGLRPLAARSRSSVRVERTSIFRDKSRKILLLKLDHMGDFMLAIPAIMKLRARYPRATLDVVVGSWNVEIAKNLGVFANVHVLDYFKKVSAIAPAGLGTEAEQSLVQLGSYDIAIDLRRQGDTRFLLAKVDARCKVGYQCFDERIDAQLTIKLDSWLDIPFQATPLNRTHTSLQMLQLVDALPADPSDYILLPVLPGSAGKTQAAVGLFPVAGNDVKEWDAANFARLAELLVAQESIDQVNVYFGSPQEARKFQFVASGKLQLHCGLSFRELVSTVSSNRVCVANNSFGAHVASYVGCFVIGVFGGHETAAEWGPAFGEGYALHTAAPCSPCHIGTRSECAYALSCLSGILVKNVFDAVMRAFALGSSGPAVDAKAREAIFEDPSSRIVKSLVQSLGTLAAPPLDVASRAMLAQSIARNHRQGVPAKQLLVDVSELVRRDAKSGIQRVVRSILVELLRSPPSGMVVEPVYATADKPGYRYARSFRQSLLGRETAASEDSVVEAWPGDIFLGLDWIPEIGAQNSVLQAWRRRGIKLYLVVYDILPLLMPDYFPDGAQVLHQTWLDTAVQSDGLIAISRSVAAELLEWVRMMGPRRIRPLQVGWFHLGADVDAARAVPVAAMPELPELLRAAVESAPAFLMVGTVEPRKGYAQALAAFELLWQEGKTASLVIVGKEGWKVAALAARLRNHPQLGKQLFWLEAASDDLLSHLYASSTALLAASEGEGFGLPLIEAARHGLPIITRDIAVFREVAGSHAFNFPNSLSPDELAAAVREWLLLYQRGTHPASEAMPQATWKQSAHQLIETILGDAWTHAWSPDGAHRFWGSDRRLHTVVGRRHGKAMRSGGVEGFLVHGPYLSLAPGRYRVVVWGEVASLSGLETLDVVADQGSLKLAHNTFEGTRAGAWKYEVEINVESRITDLEVRLWVSAASEIALVGVEIDVAEARARSGEAGDAAPVAAGLAAS
jgi:glycosyltransferase involved in cell wall biosynthesis/ADP-heptose:LPS heptosyltransferase